MEAPRPQSDGSVQSKKVNKLRKKETQQDAKSAVCHGTVITFAWPRVQLSLQSQTRDNYPFHAHVTDSLQQLMQHTGCSFIKCDLLLLQSSLFFFLQLNTGMIVS